MNIWVMSDLHIDTARHTAPTPPKGTDIIIVAGDVADGHRLSASWLARHLVSAPFDGPTVFVTHHAPHPKSLKSELFRDVTDGSFASDLEPLMLAHQPKAWIHGYVHHSRDYRVGRTRVVCNPRGYSVSRRNGRGEAVPLENPRFDPQLVIEV